MKIPCTVITGFLGAGKTTLVRHVLAHAGGRRIAVMVNEFGALGIDGEVLRSCGIPGCEDIDIVELANGCLCCTVADEFLPAMEAMLDRPDPPEHILIETSGLALPKPLLKAFGWPSVRSRVTVDGVIAVVDGPAVAAGRFADDPAAVAAQRAADGSLDHDNPLAEVYGDQVAAADLVVLNKADLMDAETLVRLRAEVAAALPRPAAMVTATEGRVDLAVLLGLDAAAEDDLAARPSCHDAEGRRARARRLRQLRRADGRGWRRPTTCCAASPPSPPRMTCCGSRASSRSPGGRCGWRSRAVGTRFRQHYDRAWSTAEPRAGHLVVIGQTGLDRAAIAAAMHA